jgi:hypothetical protein
MAMSRLSVVVFLLSNKAEYFYFFLGGGGVERWRSWLRHCATNRKFAGSVPDGVTGIFH